MARGTVRWLVLALWGAGALAACGRAPEPPESPTAIAIRTAPPERVFQGTLAGVPLHLVVHDCEVFRVEHRTGEAVEWTRVLAPDSYPFFTSCERQSLVFEQGALTATLGRRAFGAGGCCARGGTYRSTDGLHWTRRDR